MKKILLLIFLFITFWGKAQQVIPNCQPYGKIDIADLEMKSCDFEKDANAEVLIDKGDVYYDQGLEVAVEHHKRIKIFNENGKNEANIIINYIGYGSNEYITGLQGETVNLVNGKQEVTKLDKKLVYIRSVDKYRSAMVFTMPDIKAGSVIDIKYTWSKHSAEYIPEWYFQSNIPTRYSELLTHIPQYFLFSKQVHNSAPFAVFDRTIESAQIPMGTTPLSFNVAVEKRVMVDIPSLSDEPFMSSREDNLRSLDFHLTSFLPPTGQTSTTTWAKLCGVLADDANFGKQLKRKLTSEDAIITIAKALKTDDDKISFVFDTVKNTMKWSGIDEWYTIDGTAEAWNKRTGNSTEINLILCHLLKKAGINAMPMVVSTRENGKANFIYPYLYQFNRAVVYIKIDSAKEYVLDASDKFNVANEIPYDVLNASGVYLNFDDKTYHFYIPGEPETESKLISVDAEIKPDGKIKGTAQINSLGYNRVNSIKSYKTDGEKKFIDFLCDGNNSLKISSLKLENLSVDTLPFVQDINFDQDVSGDDKYIYFNPDLFTSLTKNPFLSETRYTDIDFGCPKTVILSARYKLPAGYSVDALPKNINMVMPDKSISFKRFIIQQDGMLSVRYVVSFNKWVYLKQDYPDFHEFVKQMYQMMNEQIVLKKS